MNIKYAFSREGIAAFLDAVLGDTFHALDTGGTVEDIRIIVGDREMVIPMFAEQYEELTNYLNSAITTEEENN